MLRRSMITKHRSHTPDLNAHRTRVQSGREHLRQRSDLCPDGARPRGRTEAMIFASDRLFSAQNRDDFVSQAGCEADFQAAAAQSVSRRRRLVRSVSVLAMPAFDHPKADQEGPGSGASAIDFVPTQKASLKFHVCPEADAGDQVRGATGMTALLVRGRLAARTEVPGTGANSAAEGKWCLGADSNHRHADFQSAALPAELSRPRPKGGANHLGAHLAAGSRVYRGG